MSGDLDRNRVVPTDKMLLVYGFGRLELRGPGEEVTEEEWSEDPRFLWVYDPIKLRLLREEKVRPGRMLVVRHDGIVKILRPGDLYSVEDVQYGSEELYDEGRVFKILREII